MTRVKRGFVAKRRRKKIINNTFFTSINGGFRLVKQKSMKSGLSAYKDRKTKKGQFRRLWITRINAFLQSIRFYKICNTFSSNDDQNQYFADSQQENKHYILNLKQNITYSTFIHALKRKQIHINRKLLSQLACVQPNIFYKIIIFSYLGSNGSTAT
jgi:large subunit ribosomal protein L20